MDSQKGHAEAVAKLAQDVFRLHASAAAGNCTLGSDLCGNFVHEHSLLAEPLVADGYATVPDKPGLGVELDEEAIQRYTREHYVYE